MSYDDTMRTILEIPNEKIKALDHICQRESISRAELICRAIDRYLSDGDNASVEKSFGIWKHRKINSLKYEETLGSEWINSYYTEHKRL